MNDFIDPQDYGDDKLIIDLHEDMEDTKEHDIVAQHIY